MKRRKTGISTMLILFLLTSMTPLTAFGTSYLPAEFYHETEIAKTIMKVGQTVYLFHSGTEDVKKSIHINDILIVYRIYPSCEVKIAGKIRVLHGIKDTYFQGEVIEGDIRPNDIAKKGNVSCLVISAGSCNP